jgi:hypothetical protein
MPPSSSKNPAARHRGREGRADELARLVREQQDDAGQDLTGLRSTVLGECLRRMGIAHYDRP